MTYEERKLRKLICEVATKTGSVADNIMACPALSNHIGTAHMLNRLYNEFLSEIDKVYEKETQCLR